MEIKLNGSRPSVKGPGEYFTGNVRVDPLFNAPDPSRTSGAYVTFEPCSRSNWHTHPLGQTLIVMSGCGLVQSWGGPVKLIRPGDVVWCPAGRETLAWRVARYGDDPHRNPGSKRRQGC